MPSLPVVSGREALEAFLRLGWIFKRQRGSHMVLVKPGHIASISIPDHKELRPGTLRNLIRSAGISVADFIEAVEA